MLAWIQGGGSPPAGGGAEEAPDLQGMLMHHLLDGREIEFTVLGRGYVVHLPQWEPIHIGALSIDLSPTKHVVFLVLAALLCLAVFLPIAAAMRSQSREKAPRGFGNAMEAMILYFRDDVVRRNIGHGADGYTGYILTLFVFILARNLFGLVPFGATATGNFMVTGALALITLVVVELSGMLSLGFKGYMKTIFFVPPGLNPAMSAVMLVILTPVEILSKLAKPFALMIRLFANMMAGHTLVLSLLGMIFLFAGAGLVAANGVAVASIAMVTAIMLLEIFVAFLQAYIFAMLTAVFIGLIRHAH
jgi:F-type H+-transporting ATPase subunit a